MKRKPAGNNRRRLWAGIAVLAALVGITAAWHWGPLAEQLNVRKIASWAIALQNHPSQPLMVLGAYLVGSLLSFPITLLILATAMVFGPMQGLAYSFAGCLLGAAATYAMGYFIGKDWVRQLLGSKWKRVEKKMGQTGIVAVATLRLLPVAPFTIVNVVSGALHVPVWKYFVGSLLGLAPGIVVTNLFARQFERAIRNPGPGSFALLAALIAVTVWGILWLRKRLAQDA